VELFFKWIKQHLRIKHFYGTSDNAVKTQIWISICVYVLVAIVKKQLASQRSLYSILQILSVNAFEQEPLHQVLRDSTPQMPEDTSCNQLMFNY
jgi:IS4 transposase